MMELDVIVPTYNRQELLKLTLESLLVAEIPAGLEVRVTVIDNNSKDDTQLVVQSYQKKFAGRLRYQFEPRQGRSHALNAGINSASGDLIGMIDDDEEIDSLWYATVHSAFKDNSTDFIGGPYVPRWSTSLPIWFPEDYRGVVGWVDGGDEIVPFDENYSGILMGGNAVIKRTLLERVGPYSPALGRTDKRLLSCEDEDMYQRLREAGALGFYRPDLIIYHHIPADRLTKRYFRRWCFWRGVSLGVIQRTRKSSGASLLGIPRWQYRKAARGVLSTMANFLSRPDDSAKAFSSELGIWDCLGLFYGRHFFRP